MLPLQTPQVRSKLRRILKFTLIAVGTSATIIVGCIIGFIWLVSASNGPRPVSENVDALREIVNLGVPITAVRWQISESPESGLLPNPEGVTSLVAEIELADPGWFKQRTTGPVAIIPEGNSARGWMGESFATTLRSLGEKHGTTPAGIECKKIEASVAKTNRPVDDFICRGNSNMLLYLTLDGYRDRPTSDAGAPISD